MTTMNKNVSSLDDVCVLAVKKMMEKGYVKHIQFIAAEDGIRLRSGQIAKVTVEFVDASEAEIVRELDEAIDLPRRRLREKPNRN